MTDRTIDPQDLQPEENVIQYAFLVRATEKQLQAATRAHNEAKAKFGDAVDRAKNKAAALNAKNGGVK